MGNSLEFVGILANTLPLPQRSRRMKPPSSPPTVQLQSQSQRTYVFIRLLEAPTTTTSATTTTTEEPTPNPSTWIVWTTTTMWWETVKGVCSWCVPDENVVVNHWG